MPTRVVKAHDVRKSEILACAGALFTKTGYAGTTIAAIIAETGIAKGTFYHYFASKEELLDGIVDEMVGRIFDAMRLIVDAPAPAIEKLRRIHERAGAIEPGGAEPSRSPENLAAWHKMAERTIETTVPLYARVIRQGVGEGVFDAKYPEETAEMLLRTWASTGQGMPSTLFGGNPKALESLERKLAVFEETAERVLGAARGSLGLVDASRRTVEASRRNAAERRS